MKPSIIRNLVVFFRNQWQLGIGNWSSPLRLSHGSINSKLLRITVGGLSKSWTRYFLFHFSLSKERQLSTQSQPVNSLDIVQILLLTLFHGRARAPRWRNFPFVMLTRP